jgi:hypothetical protein
MLNDVSFLGKLNSFENRFPKNDTSFGLIIRRGGS